MRARVVDLNPPSPRALGDAAIKRAIAAKTRHPSPTGRPSLLTVDPRGFTGGSTGVCATLTLFYFHSFKKGRYNSRVIICKNNNVTELKESVFGRIYLKMAVKFIIVNCIQIKR